MFGLGMIKTILLSTVICFPGLAYSVSNILYIDNSNELQQIIKDDEGVTIAILFKADWCGPCRLIKPHFEAVADRNNFPKEYKFVIVDVDQMEDAANLYNIRSVPTIQVFENGSLKAIFVGYQNEAQLQRFIVTANAPARQLY